MKPRIPLAYAGLLIVALVAVVGFAAFSPSGDDTAATTTTVAEADGPPASARVASAILALRVSNADTRTATTAAPTTTAAGVPQDTTTSTDDTTTTSEATTTSSSTTEPPTTTETPVTVASAPTTTTDSTPPALRVTSPDDGDTVDESAVTFRGTTEPGATVTSGPFDATVDDDGSWSLMLVLSPGPNGAVFTARDAAGNTTSVRIVVTYERPEPTTTTTAPPNTTTTTAAPSAPKWSPLWPADAGGRRNVEAWRPLVEQYWPADLVDCALNIIDLESEGDPRAYNSRTGAEGLFQHLSRYWKGRAAAAGFKDSNGLYATPYHAEANIAAAWLIAAGSDPWHRPWTVNPFFGACQE